MASILSAIGLRAAGACTGAASTITPNYAPAFIIFQFLFAYGVLSSRTAKQYYGIDHNVSPREDLDKYGDAAVRDGKLTRRQLEMLKRNEGAHANSVENFPLLVGGMVFATVAGVERETINAAGWTYVVARICYGLVYILIDHPKWSQLRGVTFWVANVSQFVLLRCAMKALNA